MHFDPTDEFNRHYYMAGGTGLETMRQGQVLGPGVGKTRFIRPVRGEVSRLSYLNICQTKKRVFQGKKTKATSWLLLVFMIKHDSSEGSPPLLRSNTTSLRYR